MRPKTQFHDRLTRFHEFAPNKYKIEEHFWVNRQSEDESAPNDLYCFAYGECSWQRDADAIFKEDVDSWAFEYVTEGSFIVEYVGGTRELRAGTLYVHPPGGPIRLQANGSALCKKRVIILGGTMVDYLCNLSNLRISPYIEVDDPQRLDKIFDQVKELVSCGSCYLTEDLSICGYSLITELGRTVKVLKYPRILTHAVQFIDSKLHENLTLARISEECHVSANTLSRLFRKYLNISPINHIISRRLERARHLIAVNDLCFKEIANECGYTRESFFSRAFKQKYGMAPNAYRRAILAGKTNGSSRT
jgi:AraC-like DNA-binding protein